MLFTETLFITVELLIYLSSFSLYFFDVSESRMIVVFFFLSQMAFYLLLMFAAMAQNIFGSSNGPNYRRSARH